MLDHVWLLFFCAAPSYMLLAPPVADSDGESDGESNRVPVPSFQNSFSQAFEEALLQHQGPTAPTQPLVIPGQSFTASLLVIDIFMALDCILISFLTLFQRKREGKRRRRNRSFYSAPPWFTQSRLHWSWNFSLYPHTFYLIHLLLSLCHFSMQLYFRIISNGENMFSM